jgi:hypothetical protein
MSLTVKLAECPEGCDCDGWLGGDPSSPNWEGYVAGFNNDLRPYFEVWKEWILVQNPYPCADEICNDYHFEFSDGKKFSLSWRAWGDLVQAAVNKQEGYLTYYMRGWINEETPVWTPTL